MQTKLKVYRALALPILLYASQAWTTYRRHLRKLNHFHLTCLRKIINIKWQDKIPDEEVLTRADLPSIHMQKQLPDWRTLTFQKKKLLYGQLKNGKRTKGSK